MRDDRTAAWFLLAMAVLLLTLATLVFYGQWTINGFRRQLVANEAADQAQRETIQTLRKDLDGYRKWSDDVASTIHARLEALENQKPPASASTRWIENNFKAQKDRLDRLEEWRLTKPVKRISSTEPGSIVLTAADQNARYITGEVNGVAGSIRLPAGCVVVDSQPLQLACGSKP